MKKLAYLCLIFLFNLQAPAYAAQDDNPYGIRYSASSAIDNEDIMNLYRFQNIHLAKAKFTGKGLWGKNYRISIQEVINGKAQKKIPLFDSREDEFFKLKEQEFSFSVLAQRSNDNKVRFDFRFLGFGFTREFKVNAEQRDFILKSAQDGEEEMDVPIGREFNFLSFVMPHKASGGSLRYTNLDPLSVRPDAMGIRLGIPRYYLVQIEFQ